MREATWPRSRRRAGGLRRYLGLVRKNGVVNEAVGKVRHDNQREADKCRTVVVLSYVVMEQVLSASGRQHGVQKNIKKGERGLLAGRPAGWHGPIKAGMRVARPHVRGMTKGSTMGTSAVMKLRSVAKKRNLVGKRGSGREPQAGDTRAALLWQATHRKRSTENVASVTRLCSEAREKGTKNTAVMACSVPGGGGRERERQSEREKRDSTPASRRWQHCRLGLP